MRGDQLSDARAQQAQLKKQAADQAAAIAQLQALQAGLATEIAQTRIQLNGVNADLQAVKTRIGRMTTRINAVKYAYAGLIVQLSNLDEHLAQITAQEQQKQVELQARRELLADHLRAASRTRRSRSRSSATRRSSRRSTRTSLIRAPRPRPCGWPPTPSAPRSPAASTT